jgi:ubiquinone/menaquinone biosynthesis C-methylase UbiE
VALHPDPWRAVDRQREPARLAALMEARGQTATQRRLRRRFLAFAGVRPGHHVLEVGSGTGIVARDLAALAGPRGRVTGVDVSRTMVMAARRLAVEHGLQRRVAFRRADGASLPFARGRFDAALAVTVLLHVPDAVAVLREMVRVTRPGGLVAIQDQDFGTQVLDHPDQPLTGRILQGVTAHLYPEWWSGRALFRRLVQCGLERVRLRTDVYQDTTFEPFTESLLRRRAANAVEFGLVRSAAAARWLADIERTAARGEFVFTLNFYGAAGVKPARPGGSAA